MIDSPETLVYRKIEKIGDATLYLADCRYLVPFLRADVMITDPVWPNAPKGMFVLIDEPEALLRIVLGQMPWLERAVIVLRSDSDPRFLRAIPDRLPFFLAQVLQYVMPGYIGRKLGGNEIAYSFGPPLPSAPGRRVIPGMSPKVQPDGRAANGHPCSRAYEHFDWLMRWHTDPGQTVIDPFMGNGTTGYSAIRAGRKFIGIEVEEKYFDIACGRIEQAQKQGRLFA
jgi:site-specific DNA-methyltransferase (adenine-specific)